jgi:hypothetical protein
MFPISGAWKLLKMRLIASRNCVSRGQFVAHILPPISMGFEDSDYE